MRKEDLEKGFLWQFMVHQQMVIMLISLNFRGDGHIVYLSHEQIEFLKFSKSQLLYSSFNKLIPKQMIQSHEVEMIKYLKQSSFDLRQIPKTLIFQTRNETSCFCDIIFQPYYNTKNKNIDLITILGYHDHYKYSILLDETGQILLMSEYFAIQYGTIFFKMIQEGINIVVLCPNMFKYLSDNSPKFRNQFSDPQNLMQQMDGKSIQISTMSPMLVKNFTNDEQNKIKQYLTLSDKNKVPFKAYINELNKLWNSFNFNMFGNFSISVVKYDTEKYYQMFFDNINYLHHPPLKFNLDQTNHVLKKDYLQIPFVLDIDYNFTYELKLPQLSLNTIKERKSTHMSMRKDLNQQDLLKNKTLSKFVEEKPQSMDQKTIEEIQIKNKDQAGELQLTELIKIKIQKNKKRFKKKQIKYKVTALIVISQIVFLIVLMIVWSYLYRIFIHEYNQGNRLFCLIFQMQMIGNFQKITKEVSDYPHFLDKNFRNNIKNFNRELKYSSKNKYLNFESSKESQIKTQFLPQYKLFIYMYQLFQMQQVIENGLTGTITFSYNESIVNNFQGDYILQLIDGFIQQSQQERIDKSFHQIILIFCGLNLLFFLIFLTFFVVQEIFFLLRIKQYMNLLKEIKSRSINRVFQNFKKFYQSISLLEKNIKIDLQEFFLKDLQIQEKQIKGFSQNSKPFRFFKGRIITPTLLYCLCPILSFIIVYNIPFTVSLSYQKIFEIRTNFAEKIFQVTKLNTHLISGIGQELRIKRYQEEKTNDYFGFLDNFIKGEYNKSAYNYNTNNRVLRNFYSQLDVCINQNYCQLYFDENFKLNSQRQTVCELNQNLDQKFEVIYNRNKSLIFDVYSIYSTKIQSINLFDTTDESLNELMEIYNLLILDLMQSNFLNEGLMVLFNEDILSLENNFQNQQENMFEIYIFLMIVFSILFLYLRKILIQSYSQILKRMKWLVKLFDLDSKKISLQMDKIVSEQFYQFITLQKIQISIKLKSFLIKKWQDYIYRAQQ